MYVCVCMRIHLACLVMCSIILVHVGCCVSSLSRSFVFGNCCRDLVFAKRPCAGREWEFARCMGFCVTRARYVRCAKRDAEKGRQLKFPDAVPGACDAAASPSSFGRSSDGNHYHCQADKKHVPFLCTFPLHGPGAVVLDRSAHLFTAFDLCNFMYAGFANAA